MRETASQRIERIKKEKNGLDVLADIYRYAKTKEEIFSEDIDRFKWYGLYTQNKNLQAKDDDRLYFMLRVKLKGGLVNYEQLKTLSEISHKFARDTGDITVREDLQLHFIKVEDLPTIYELLENVGINCTFAAGDVPRNIIISSASGVDKDEIIDISEIFEELSFHVNGNREYSNLPRKFKIGISSTLKDSIHHEIQDLCFVAHKIGEKVKFLVYVGGGLASNKRFSNYIADIDKEQIIPTCRAVLTIFRDYGLREKRNKSRLGHLIDSWGLEKFISEFEKLVDFKVQKGEEKEYENSKQRGYYGVFDSKVEGKSYIGCSLYNGHIGYEGLSFLEKLFKKYQISHLRFTPSQDFIILDAPKEFANKIAKELETADITAYPSAFRMKTQACTGIDFCKFAVSPTKSVAYHLIKHLESKFHNFNETISISVNGCINSCSHPNVADIGLVGTKLIENGKNVNGFELIVAGSLEGKNSKFAQKTGIKFSVGKTNEMVENLIVQYQKSNYASFNEFLQTKIKE